MYKSKLATTVLKTISVVCPLTVRDSNSSRTVGRSQWVEGLGACSTSFLMDKGAVASFHDSICHSTGLGCSVEVFQCCPICLSRDLSNCGSSLESRRSMACSVTVSRESCLARPMGSVPSLLSQEVVKSGLPMREGVNPCVLMYDDAFAPSWR